MAITKTYLGDNPDGSAHFHYDAGPDGIVLMTGPVNGPLTLPDGTVYDVTDPYIEVASEEHAGLVSHLMGMRYEERGHPKDGPDTPFRHQCSEHCGELRREDTP